jgi:hypothetical protein
MARKVVIAYEESEHGADALARVSIQPPLQLPDAG